MTGIGLLNEKPLHASLKAWYAQPGDRIEVAVDGYVIDIVRGDLLIEIQTSNLSSIKSKLTNLVRSHRVRLVLPITQEKWIIKMPQKSGEKATRRKSPRRGGAEDLFWGMVSLSQLIANDNFSLEILFIREEEVRRYKRKRRWNRWSTEERRLLEVAGRRVFQTPEDWREFIPEKPEPFTVKDYAAARGVRLPLAQRIVYCLRKAGLITPTGKCGRANLYSRAGTP